MVKISLRQGNVIGDKRFANLEGNVRCVEHPPLKKYPLSLKVDILDETNSQFYIGFDKDEVEVLQKHFNREFDKIKEERDDFLKVLQAGNTRALRNEKKVKSKKVRRLIDYAIELGLIEKSGEFIIQNKEKHDDVTNEWNELDIFIDKPKVEHTHVHIGKDELLKNLKKKKE